MKVIAETAANVAGGVQSVGCLYAAKREGPLVIADVPHRRKGEGLTV